MIIGNKKLYNLKLLSIGFINLFFLFTFNSCFLGRGVENRNSYLKVCSLPEIGTKIPSYILENYNSGKMMMTNIGREDMKRSFIISFNQIEYMVAIERDSVVSYIGVWDKNFFTSDTIKIGSTLNDILNVPGVTKKDIKPSSRFWTYYVKLPSNWIAVFHGDDESMSVNYKPPLDLKIVGFCKFDDMK